jgi:hypothetical protein
MIYLLSGLLIFHGIICFLGAFFPLYPPVYFFYWFLPSPFVIKLITVLLAGAFQVVYGVYLLIRKRWRVKWYWLVMTIIVITGLFLVYPAFSAPGLFTRLYDNGEAYPTPAVEEPPYPAASPGPDRPDDIVPTPGGLAYRANVHQEGVENPWPPIQTEETALDTDVHIIYRAYIETGASESRNNIFLVRIPDQDIQSINLKAIDIPNGIGVKDGIKWQGPRTIAQVLVIEISKDVQPGEYTFKIFVEIDNKDYGIVPCTIKVL